MVDKLYVIHAVKRESDEYGRAYDHYWDASGDEAKVLAHARMVTETCYADVITVEVFQKVFTSFTGAGVPVSARRAPALRRNT